MCPINAFDDFGKPQLPEKEIDAVPELPKLVDLKTSQSADTKVRLR